jgi:hypothetical protein
LVVCEMAMDALVDTFTDIHDASAERLRLDGREIVRPPASPTLRSTHPYLQEAQKRTFAQHGFAALPGSHLDHA